MSALRELISVVTSAALVAALCVGSSVAADRPGRGDQTPIQAEPEEQERPIAEQRVAPPPYPRDSDLAEFKLRNPTSNRFLVDTSSLTVGKDAIIRFVLVIRTAGDETNVRFSGVRCSDRTWKDYAFVGNDKKWKVDADAQWRDIQELRYNNYQETLYGDYFCLGRGVWTSGKPVGDARKLAKLLRNPPTPDRRVPNRSD
jgi:CNP1-like family protein